MTRNRDVPTAAGGAIAAPVSARPLDNAAAPGDAAGSRCNIRVHRLGCTPYEPTWRAMQAFTAARGPGTADEIWLTEHPPIYTLGLAGRREHLLRETAVPVLKVDRGGQITYHGPGQLVVYLMIDLRRSGLGVRAMVREIESGVIEWLDSVGVSAYGKEAAPGVYVRRGGFEAKIAALGLRVRNGCTYHGFCMNIDMDLRPFNDIDPCGFPGLFVTQLAEFIDGPTVAAAGTGLAPVLARRMCKSPR